jgi:hypothetical protein
MNKNILMLAAMLLTVSAGVNVNAAVPTVMDESAAVVPVAKLQNQYGNTVADFIKLLDDTKKALLECKTEQDVNAVNEKLNHHFNSINDRLLSNQDCTDANEKYSKLINLFKQRRAEIAEAQAKEEAAAQAADIAKAQARAREEEEARAMAEEDALLLNNAEERSGLLSPLSKALLARVAAGFAAVAVTTAFFNPNVRALAKTTGTQAANCLNSIIGSARNLKSSYPNMANIAIGFGLAQLSLSEKAKAVYAWMRANPGKTFGGAAIAGLALQHGVARHRDTESWVAKGLKLFPNRNTDAVGVVK